MVRRMRLEDLAAGMALTGLETSTVATVVAIVPIAEGAKLVMLAVTFGLILGAPYHLPPGR